MVRVTGDSATGKAADDATAVESFSFERSLHRRSKVYCVKGNGTPSTMSAASSIRYGRRFRFARSPKVAS